MNPRDLYPVLFCGLSIPLSMFMWIGNVAFSRLSQSIDDDEQKVIPPTRWLFSTLAPLLFAVVALKRKSVNKSGAALGIVVAFVLSISSHMFFACLVTFFFSSSRATKFRAHIKKKIEKDFKDGEGQRNWVQVLCNGGMATQLAILYIIDCGSSERPIDFQQHYRSSWLGIAILIWATVLNRMQSFLFVGLGLLVVCGFGNAAPVDVDQLNNNNDSETRLIVPPEMTSNYFELLKNKSEKDSTKAEKADYTPMNFLRSGDDTDLKKNPMPLKPLLAFDGGKQAPIFITIPIYITSDGQGMPIIATSIEQIGPSKMPSEDSKKTENKKLEESASVSPAKENETTAKAN
ncbi:uncharacterized protein LOC129918605 isoform X1 [Episyrphus balteatus]|uniref:uncharacterized protein LOC129918605 isoform X1 n=1 Tax=Episyrphus balteatus TaxID=286459 RepID=UPI0024864BCA|nr:uncharacterized protein LOC129918605 isoform X1 [Episyrphus balteatus]